MVPIRILWKAVARAMAFGAAALCAPIAASAMSVSPMVVDLQTSGQRLSQVVTIENRYARQVIIEIRVQEVVYTDDGIKGTGKESEDLVVFPPQAIIEPGKSQAIRIQYVGDPELARGKHYFVTVAQLPVKLPEGDPSVQLLYNFQVVVGVNMAGAQSALRVDKAGISTSGDGKPRLELTMKNDATAYGYLSGGTLKIVEKDASGKEVFSRTMTGEQISQEIGFGLVGAGQTRRIATPIVLPQAGGSVEASFTPNR